MDRIVTHRGSETAALFKIKWSAGDGTWLTYPDAAKLAALQDYMDILGIQGISELKSNDSSTIEENEIGVIPTVGSVSLETDDLRTSETVNKRRR